jgi:bifunctional oligoribonuclease and PAP phosphatase NrnA
MLYTHPDEAAFAIASALSHTDRVLLLTHQNPDGDAIGTLLGLWHALTSTGKSVSAVIWPVLPHYVLTLPGIEHVQVYMPGMELPEADVAIMVDVAEIARIGRIYDDYAMAFETMPLIVIDHHRAPTGTGDGTINLIVPEMASCAELLYELLCALNIPLPQATATCLLLGLFTDTQSFQTNSTNAETLAIAAALLRSGANLQFVVRAVYYSVPYPSLQLLGQALHYVQREHDLIWTHISQAMLRQVGLVDDTGEEIIRWMQRVVGIRVCVLFKERPDGAIKLSLRSTPGIDVAAIASQWNGGGHTQAAGAVLKMDLNAAQKVVLGYLRSILFNELRRT